MDIDSSFFKYVPISLEQLHNTPIDELPDILQFDYKGNHYIGKIIPLPNSYYEICHEGNWATFCMIDDTNDYLNFIILDADGDYKDFMLVPTYEMENVYMRTTDSSVKDFEADHPTIPRIEDMAKKLYERKEGWRP